MTRICVLGNSHMGAIRRSRDVIAKKYPHLDVQYFGAPGRLLRSCYVDENGFFGPTITKPGQEKIMLAVNGAVRFDVTRFDLCLIVGYQFHFGDLLRVLSEHDVLGMASTGKNRICSDEFFEDFTDSLVERYVHTNSVILECDQSFILSPAPYPSEETLQPGVGYKRTVANLASHPDGTAIFERFQVKIEKAINRMGHGFLRQPQQTVVGTYLTHHKYSRGSVDIQDENIVKDDYTHMNGEFGLLLFEKFVQTFLPKLSQPHTHLPPRPHDEPTPDLIKR